MFGGLLSIFSIFKEDLEKKRMCVGRFAISEITFFQRA